MENPLTFADMLLLVLMVLTILIFAIQAARLLRHPSREKDAGTLDARLKKRGAEADETEDPVKLKKLLAEILGDVKRITEDINTITKFYRWWVMPAMTIYLFLMIIVFIFLR